jgi:serine/threonine-protein kinase
MIRLPGGALSTIGRYQIIEKVGQGGMGVVYRAHDSLLEREVALKIISASIEGNPELRERFFREARAAGQLSHRNIITIHDLGEHEGQPYLAMEYLVGEDLQKRLSRPEPMSLARKLEIAADICEGLSYAHRRGLIHRDIKPANIFITEEGVVKLLDFGLARMVTSELTASNMMLGTLNYMAPEQVRGERTDHRADIFSFGVVLYEILSGRKAFQGDSFATTLYKILQDVPEPLQNIDASLPHEVVRLVEKSIAKLKDERYQDLSDLARDLALHRQHLALSDSDTMAIPVPSAFRSPSSPRVSSDPPRSTGAPRPDSGQRPKSGPRTADASAPANLSDATTTIARAPASRVSTTRQTWWVAGGALAIVLGVLVANQFFRGQPEPAQQVVSIPQTPPPAAQPLPQPPEASPGGAATPAPPAPQALVENNARLLADARTRMNTAKASARQKGAAAQRSPAYTAALAAEREGSRLQDAKRTGEAAEKFYEAAGLFRSAELAANTAPAREPSSVETARADPARPEPAPAPSAQTPTAPSPAAPAPATPPSQAVAPPPEAPVPTPPAAVPGPPIPPLTRNTPAASQPPPASARAAEDEVRELVRRYEQALESRSLDSLKRIWPSLQGAQENAVRQEFAQTRRIDVDIEGLEVSVSGTTATATFVRRYQLTTVDGQRPLRNSRTTMNARRVGGEWVIERVRFEALE